MESTVEIVTSIDTNEDPDKVIQKNRASLRDLLMLIYRQGEDEMSWREDFAFMSQEEIDVAKKESIFSILDFVDNITGEGKILETILESSIEQILNVSEKFGEKVLSEKINTYFKNLLEQKKEEAELFSIEFS